MPDSSTHRSSSGAGPGAFVTRLESVRGLAALTVAISHSFRVLPAEGTQGVVTHWIGCIFNGSAAVTLFFVLSGYVLGLSLRHAGDMSASKMLAFAARRFLRIYPVFFLSTLVVLGCVWCSAGFGWPFPEWWSGTGDYHHEVLNPAQPPSAGVVLGNLLLWNPSLNLVTWTLGIELRCSLLLPLLHWASGRLAWRSRMMLLLGLVVAACLGKWCQLLGSAKAGATMALFHWAGGGYLFLFYLGYLLPDLGARMQKGIHRSAAVRWLFPWGPLLLLLWADKWGDDLKLLQSVGAASLIIHLVNGARGRGYDWLEGSWATFQGRVSYSFYLWHDLVLIVLARTLLHFTPATVWKHYPVLCGGILLLVSVPIALAMASACFNRVEKPFIMIGKRLSGKITGQPVRTRGPGPAIQEPALPHDCDPPPAQAA